MHPSSFNVKSSVAIIPAAIAAYLPCDCWAQLSEVQCCCLQGVRIEVETGAGASWPAEPYLDQLLMLLVAAPSLKLPSQLLAASQTSASQRCKDAYAAVKVCYL